MTNIAVLGVDLGKNVCSVVGLDASGGWGFADFTNGKPGNQALHEKCFPCHLPAKDRDYVFTHYAPTP